MYKKIMVPVDLEHVEAAEKSFDVAADQAAKHKATLYYVAITTKVPNMAAPSPEKFNEALEQFAKKQSEKYGLPIEAKGISSVDVSRELHKQLLKVAEEIDADLIVMASHVPTVADKLHLVSSHAGHIAGHAKCSVYVVR